MSLGVRKGDHIVIQASGADAETAVAALEQAIAGGKDSHAGAATLAVTGGTASAASARRRPRLEVTCRIQARRRPRLQVMRHSPACRRPRRHCAAARERHARRSIGRRCIANNDTAPTGVPPTTTPPALREQRPATPRQTAAPHLWQRPTPPRALPQPHPTALSKASSPAAVLASAPPSNSPERQLKCQSSRGCRPRGHRVRPGTRNRTRRPRALRQF